MGQFGGYFKGEKKKKKKGADFGKGTSSNAPVFVPPKIISKGKKEV